MAVELGQALRKRNPLLFLTKTISLPSLLAGEGGTMRGASRRMWGSPPHPAFFHGRRGNLCITSGSLAQESAVDERLCDLNRVQCRALA
jgi:hypothetical protein